LRQLSFLPAILVAAIVCPLAAQQFETASIKPNNSDIPGPRGLVPHVEGNRFVAGNVSLGYLIRGAYQLHDYQLTGGPGWIYSDRFDIEAKAEGESRITREQMHTMLQRLIVDRFQLKTRRETKQLPVYELIVTSNGHKLREGIPVASNAAGIVPLTFLLPPGIPGPPPPPPGGGRGVPPGPPRERFAPGVIVSPGLTMRRLAELLTLQLERPVVDKTGLVGNYNVNLTWMPEPSSTLNLGIGPRNAPPPSPVAVADPSLPSIFTALQEDLGLRLNAAAGPVDVFVVDAVMKPTPN